MTLDFVYVRRRVETGTRLPTAVAGRGGHLDRAVVGRGARSGVRLARVWYDTGAPDRCRDHALGGNTAAVTLESLTVRRRVRSALDLGCGGGIQAMFAARHSEH